MELCVFLLTIPGISACIELFFALKQFCYLHRTQDLGTLRRVTMTDEKMCLPYSENNLTFYRFMIDFSQKTSLIGI
jgi:hypothetical protein